MPSDNSQEPEDLADLMGCDPEAVDVQAEDEFALEDFVRRSPESPGMQYVRELEELSAEIESPEETVADKERRRSARACAARIGEVLAAWEAEDARVGIVIALRGSDEDGYADLGERLVVAEGVLRAAEVGWALVGTDTESAQIGFNLPSGFDDIGMSESGEMLALRGPLGYKFVHPGSGDDQQH